MNATDISFSHEKLKQALTFMSNHHQGNAIVFQDIIEENSQNAQTTTKLSSETECSTSNYEEK